MKTIVISLFMVLWMSTIQAQTVMQLDAATVTYKAPKLQLHTKAPKVVTTSNLTNLDFEIKEDYENHFMKNPIKFLQENFDVNSLNLKDGGLGNIEVSFLSRKGYLKATFDNKGELVKTSQRFRNIELPQKVWRDIYKENLGWTMASNIYKANGKGNRINNELYKVKLTQGKQKKYVKYVPAKIERGRVAVN